MLRSLYTAATGMEAQQLRMDTIANNLANANTTGFRKTRAEFEDLLSETFQPAGAPTAQGGGRPSPLQVGLGVRTVSTQRSGAVGDPVPTNNPLDIFIQGDGFLRVQLPNGDYAYTRSGNLTKDAQGRIVTQRGDMVEPGITIPPESKNVSIQPNGIVTVDVPGRDNVEVGQLELTMFVNPAGLESVGGNLFRATLASGDPIATKPGEHNSGTLLQGQLESSNVKAVEEMIGMISTQRSYELNSKVIQTADQMLQRLTSLR